jgi:hypothetical protein
MVWLNRGTAHTYLEYSFDSYSLHLESIKMQKIMSGMALLALLLTHSTAADELQVPSQYPTIADAVAVAHPGDVIVLGEGVFVGSVEIPRIDIALRGAGMHKTTIVPKFTPDIAGGTVIHWDGRFAGQPAAMDLPLLSDLSVSGFEGGDRSSRKSWQVPFKANGPGGGELQMRRVRFQDHDNAHTGGSYVSTIGQFEMRDCVFEDMTCEEGSLRTVDVLQVVVSGCRFLKCGGYAAPLRLERFDVAVVENCSFQGTPSMWDHTTRPTLRLFGDQALVRNCSFGAAGPDYTNPIGRSVQLSLFLNQGVVLNCAFDSDTQIGGGANVVFVNCVGSGLPSGNGNIIADPGWINAGHPGADGVWRTEDDNLGDLTPAHHSPLIDAVDGLDSDIFATDAIGNPRLVDAFKATNQGSGHFPYLDIGAIEFQDGSLPCLADVNRDGSVTPTDFTAWINAFNNNLPECDQNGDGSCTPTDFTAWIANFNAGCP